MCVIGGRGGGVEWVWWVKRGGDGVYKENLVYGWMERGSELAKENKEEIFTRAKWCRVIQVVW